MGCEGGGLRACGRGDAGGVGAGVVDGELVLEQVGALGQVVNVEVGGRIAVLAVGADAVGIDVAG